MSIVAVRKILKVGGVQRIRNKRPDSNGKKRLLQVSTYPLKIGYRPDIRIDVDATKYGTALSTLAPPPRRPDVLLGHLFLPNAERPEHTLESSVLGLLMAQEGQSTGGPISCPMEQQWKRPLVSTITNGLSFIGRGGGIRTHDPLLPN